MQNGLVELPKLVQAFTTRNVIQWNLDSAANLQKSQDLKSPVFISITAKD